MRVRGWMYMKIGVVLLTEPSDVVVLYKWAET